MKPDSPEPTQGQEMEERQAALDARLAEFADRVLAGKAAQPEAEAPEAAANETDGGVEEELELAELEETILRLNRAVKAARPDAAAAARIAAPLQASWQSSTKKPGFFSRLLSSILSGSGMGFAAAVAVVAALVILAVGLLALPGGEMLAGAAMPPSSAMPPSQGTGFPIWLPLGLASVLVLVWVFFRKGRS